MSQHWKSLVSNMDILLHLSQLNHRAGLDSQEKSEMDLADLEFATSLVAKKVGDHPATLGTNSLFRLVEDVVEDMGKLHKLVSTLESPEFAAAQDLQQGVKIVGKDIIGHLNPVFCLFGLFLRAKDALGDILEERLHALESRTNALSALAPAADTGPAWSFNNRMQGLSVQGSLTRIESKEALNVWVQFLEAQLKDMQDKMTAERPNWDHQLRLPDHGQGLVGSDKVPSKDMYIFP
jgi:hypothetical protein